MPARWNLVSSYEFAHCLHCECLYGLEIRVLSASGRHSCLPCFPPSLPLPPSVCAPLPCLLSVSPAPRKVFAVAHCCLAYNSVTRNKGWTSQRNGGGWMIDRNVDGRYDCHANRGGYIFADYPPSKVYNGADCNTGHHMGSSLKCH